MAGLLVGATLLGRWPLAVTVALLQALLLLGLVRGSDVPAARTSGVLALVVGLGTTVLVAAGPEQPPGSADLLPVAAAPGAALVAMAVVQLARRDRARLTASFTFGVSIAVLAVMPVFWLALWSEPEGTALQLVALAGAATAAAFAVFPGPRLLWVAGGAIAAAGVGLLVRAYASDVASAVSPGPAAALAAVAGLAAAGGLWASRLVAADHPPSGPAETALLAASTAPTLAAPVSYGLAWLLLA